MRAYVVEPPFGLDAVRLVDRPMPRLSAGEVLIRIRAVSLNYRDLLVIRGVWRPSGPRIPVSDGVGEVVALGEGVAGFQLGERVAGTFLPGWLDGDLTPEKLQLASPGGSSADGMMAEYVALSQDALVRVPTHLSDEEAATLPLAGVTAWNAVVRQEIKAGDSVLVQGTGGVSLFALQFARMLGARVIATSSSDEKLRAAGTLGADGLVNYRTTPGWSATVLDLTGGRGVDHVVEVVGGENLNESLKALRFGGSIAFVGQMGGMSAPVDTFAFVEKLVRLRGVYVGSREMFEEMSASISAHQLRPVVDRIYDFEDFPEALRQLQAGAMFGKLCVRVAGR
jgi:NADPH:quinone reductase-like Zn-dependent oxidoreductase